MSNKLFHLFEKLFADKIYVGKLVLSEEGRKLMLERHGQETLQIVEKAIAEYEAAWLKETKCPNCDAELFGPLGAFRWTIVHGIGYCNKCEQVWIRLYHYLPYDAGIYRAPAVASVSQKLLDTIPVEYYE